MNLITGKEQMFENIVFSDDVINLINQSATLVAQLLQYNKNVTLQLTKPFGNDMNKNGAFWDPNATVNAIVFGSFYGKPVTAYDALTIVGFIAHEIGHYVNAGVDAARSSEFGNLKSESYHFAAWLGLYGEGEAIYNSYVIEKEIAANTGKHIAIIGDDKSKGNIKDVLDKSYEAAIKQGMSTAQIAERMANDGASYYAGLKTSTDPTGPDYYHMYGSFYGAKEGSGMPASPVAAYAFVSDPASGRLKQLTETLVDGTTKIINFDASLAFTTALYGSSGQLTQYASYTANSFKTQEVFYGSSGMKTKQYDFNLDNSYTARQYNIDGSQIATLFGINGQVTESAVFNANQFRPKTFSTVQTENRRNNTNSISTRATRNTISALTVPRQRWYSA